jgi:hypothetical protein
MNVPDIRGHTRAGVVDGHSLWSRWLIPLVTSLADYAGLAF